MHILWMMLKNKGHSNIYMMRLGCCLAPLSEFVATRLSHCSVKQHCKVGKETESKDCINNEL